jgi:hypothetical protein
MSAVNSLTTPIVSILPIALMIMIIIYRAKIWKVIVEFFIALAIMIVLLIISGFMVALVQVSFLTIFLIFAGLVIMYKLVHFNIRDMVYATIFMLLAMSYILGQGINNITLLIFIVGIFLVMIMNIKEIGKDDSIPYKN